MKARPIAMRATQEQFESIKPKLDSFQIAKQDTVRHKLPYLVTNYGSNIGIIGFCGEWNKEANDRNCYETWNERIFLEACGIESKPSLSKVKEYFKNAEKIECLSDSDTYFLDFSEDLEFCSDSIRLLNQKDDPFSGIKTYCKIWDKIKGYAKIISYKEETYQITKEQILVTHASTSIFNQGEIEKWFPSVFKEDKKELVIGKWYISEFVDKKGYRSKFLAFIENVKEEKNYGFDFFGEWKTNMFFENKTKTLREATPQEIQQALENEWKRLGGGVGVYFKTPVNEFPCIDNGIYTFQDNKLYSNGTCVFNDGKFASIVPQYTKQEVEEKLNCKIV